MEANGFTGCQGRSGQKFLIADQKIEDIQLPK